MSYKNKEWLYDQYINQKKSYKIIGIFCNVSEVTIGNWVRKFGFRVRTARENQLGKVLSKETRAKISKTVKEKCKDPEVRKKMSEQFKKNWDNKEIREAMLANRPSRKGDKNPSWKGDKASKGAFHRYIEKYKPKPDNCEICDKKTTHLDLSNKNHIYTRNVDDYWYICRSCHHKYDIEKGLRPKPFIDCKKRPLWHENIKTKEEALKHLEWMKENRHIRNYFMHKAKLKEMGLIG